MLKVVAKLICNTVCKNKQDCGEGWRAPTYTVKTCSRTAHTTADWDIRVDLRRQLLDYTAPNINGKSPVII